MEPLIRPAASVDCVRISELTRKYFPYMPLSADAIFDRMKNGIRYFVLGHEGRVKGYIDFEINPAPNPKHETQNGPLATEKTVKILGLCVEEELQGKGYGRKL